MCVGVPWANATAGRLAARRAALGAAGLIGRVPLYAGQQWVVMNAGRGCGAVFEGEGGVIMGRAVRVRHGAIGDGGSGGGGGDTEHECSPSQCEVPEQSCGG